MAKVIDIRSRLKQNDNTHAPTETEAEVLTITEARQEMIQEERRKAKRTILQQFIGAFVVVPQKGLLKVNLFDISEEGLSFDLDMDLGRFQRREEVAMRIYLSRDTYFPITAEVNYSRVIPGENRVRHGVVFSKNIGNDIALHYFVKFVESVAPSLRKDQGDLLVSNYS